MIKVSFGAYNFLTEIAADGSLAGELADGQKQRICIARVLVAEPEFIYLLFSSLPEMDPDWLDELLAERVKRKSTMTPAGN